MMKRAARLLSFAAIGTLTTVSLCPAALAQRGGRGGGARVGTGGRGGEIQMDEQTVIDLATAILHLTDMQKQQVQTIFDAAVKAAIPIAAQVDNNQNTLFDAVKAGKSEADLEAMAAQQGSLRGQILALQAQTFARMWALLTPDQKQEAGILIYDGIGQFLSNPRPPVPTTLPNLTVPGVNQVPPQTTPPPGH